MVRCSGKLPLQLALSTGVPGLVETLVEYGAFLGRVHYHELPLPAEKCTILENKYQPVQWETTIPPVSETRFVFSGTISHASGILQAISLIRDFHQAGYAVKLTVVGQVPDYQLRRQLQAINEPFLRLAVDEKPVAHTLVLQHMREADFGIVAHQPDASNVHCIPTRIYELLGLQKPILLQKNAFWEAVVEPYQAALVLDFNDYKAPEIWKQLQQTTFYTTHPGSEVTWASEAPKLQALLAD